MREAAGQPCIERSNMGQISFGRPGPPLYIARLFESRELTGTAMTTSEDRLNSTQSAAALAGNWRTPALIIGFGCLIAMMNFGPRSSLGFFLTPLSNANHWGRDVFAFALALQNLLWGIGQPLAGIIADRFGTARVICVGALMYGSGLALMAHATSVPMLDISAGVLIGFGLSGCSFLVILAAFGKLLPPQWRSRAYGFGTAAGSFGQFLYSPVAVALMDSFGWQQTLVIFAATLLLYCRCRSHW
jgi:MFS family permease